MAAGAPELLTHVPSFHCRLAWPANDSVDSSSSLAIPFPAHACSVPQAVTLHVQGRRKAAPQPSARRLGAALAGPRARPRGLARLQPPAELCGGADPVQHRGAAGSELRQHAPPQGRRVPPCAVPTLSLRSISVPEEHRWYQQHSAQRSKSTPYQPPCCGAPTSTLRASSTLCGISDDLPVIVHSTAKGWQIRARTATQSLQSHTAEVSHPR